MTTSVFPKWCAAKDFGKNYLGTSNFAAFVRQIRRERKSVNSGRDFFLEITMILGRKLRNH